MKMKKLIATLLTASMVFSMAACGSKDPKEATGGDASGSQNQEEQSSDAGQNNDAGDEGSEDSAGGPSSDGDYGGLVKLPGADDPITYKFFVRDPGTSPSKDNPVLNKITELTGITIEFEYLVGDLDQKVGVMIAGEDYPDAIFAEAAKFVDAGAFIPIEDYIAKYPNLNDHYARYERDMTTADGHQYIFELYSVVENPAPVFHNGGSSFFIQKAVLEDAGYVIPRTLDEYFTLISDYKAKNPEIDGMKTIGFEVLCDGWRDFCLRNPALHLMGEGNEGDVIVDQDTLEASYYQISDTAREYYRKLNQEYHAGTIEAETLTQNYDQYISRISSGAVLGFFDQKWNFQSAEEVLKADGKYERTYVEVPITNEGVKDGYLDAPSTTSITGVNGIGITKNCENPERLVEFFDWILQKEVQDYLQWGEEGVDYIAVEGGGKMLTDERRAINRDAARKRDETGDALWQMTPKRQGLYADGSPCGPGDSEDEYLAALSDYEQEFLTAYGFKYPAEFLSEPVVRKQYYPVWGFTIEDGSPAAVAKNKMEDVCRMYYPRLIICDESEYDALWETFLSEFEKANVGAYVDEVNRQIPIKMGE